MRLRWRIDARVHSYLIFVEKFGTHKKPTDYLEQVEEKNG